MTTTFYTPNELNNALLSQHSDVKRPLSIDHHDTPATHQKSKSQSHPDDIKNGANDVSLKPSFKYPSLPSDLDPLSVSQPSTTTPSPLLPPLPLYTPASITPLLPPRATRPSPAPRPPPEPLPEIHSGPALDVFKKVIEGESDLADEGHPPEDAFFVCDLKRVYDQYLRWMKELGPGSKDDQGNEVTQIEPFFAVKCNPDPLILRLLSSLSLGFDCASKTEIDLILSLSVSPNRIIYANPCKASSYIRHAAKENVDLMTFDNADELVKVARFHPGAKMVLRILADDSGSLCRFGTKFGADVGKARGLLRRARELGLEVKGVSFHVGSGCTNPALYGDAVRRARYVFDVAKEEGFELDLLDVGGGFGDENFEEIARELRNELARSFPKGEGVRVIAEPGRYFVTRAFELATNVIAKREKVAKEEGGEEGANTMFYINDGVYGAFNCTMFDHQIVTPHILTLSSQFLPSLPASCDLSPCQVWGPTCDSIDLVSSSAPLPADELEVGDWLRWEEMGAYTICAASRFNGMKRSGVVYTVDVEGVQREEGREMERRIRELVQGEWE